MMASRQPAQKTLPAFETYSWTFLSPAVFGVQIYISLSIHTLALTGNACSKSIPKAHRRAFGIMTIST